MPKQDVKFIASYNPHKQVMGISGDGAAEIKLTTDAMQLATILSSLAEFKDSSFEVILRKVNGKEKKQRRKAKQKEQSRLSTVREIVEPGPD